MLLYGRFRLDVLSTPKTRRGERAQESRGVMAPAPNKQMLSVRCTWGSDGSVERTGGEARYLVYQALDSETPLGTDESTRTTRNGVNFRDVKDTGRRSRCTRSGDRRIDAVSIGRGQASGPCSHPVREVHRNLIGE